MRRAILCAALLTLAGCRETPQQELNRLRKEHAALMRVAAGDRKALRKAEIDYTTYRRGLKGVARERMRMRMREVRAEIERITEEADNRARRMAELARDRAIEPERDLVLKKPRLLPRPWHRGDAER